MNKVILLARTTKDPEVRYGGANNTAIASFTLAAERRFKQEGQPTADFINCKAFGKQAEFIEKYVHKGTKLAVEGHIQTGSYTNKDGNTVYTTDVIVESVEFGESKAAATNNAEPTPQGNAGAGPKASNNGMPDFMQIPSDADDDFPFK